MARHSRPFNAPWSERLERVSFGGDLPGVWSATHASFECSVNDLPRLTVEFVQVESETDPELVARGRRKALEQEKDPEARETLEKLFELDRLATEAGATAVAEVLDPPVDGARFRIRLVTEER